MSKLDANSAYIFRITHIDNVPWILDNGIHCRNSRVIAPNFIPIGMAELIEKRAARRIDAGPGGTLADYVPFYFTPHSIMAYHIRTGYGGVIKRANSEIAVLVSSLHKLRAMNVPFLFTTAHAYMSGVEYIDDLSRLREIAWDLLGRRDFKLDPENPGKQARYQAEALVHKHMPIEALIGIACYDAAGEARLRQAADQRSLTIDVKSLPHLYFR